MYVASSRSRRIPNDGEWIILQSDDGSPPKPSKAKPDTFPPGFLNSLTDPLVILIHGYNNTERQAFGQYALEIGTKGKKGLMAANGFTGSVIAYDWPSVETSASAPLTVYENDLKAARTTGAEALVDFVQKLSAALDGKNLRFNLMAHSMGNLVVRMALTLDSTLASKLDSIFSFGADLPVADMERSEIIKSGDTLSSNWFVYWAQADLILLSLSNWANIILGNEAWGGQRVGQQGILHPSAVSSKVISQEWDQPIAEDIGSHYNWDLREWQFNQGVHCAYWANKSFLKNVADNLLRKPGAAPILAKWPPPPQV